MKQTRLAAGAVGLIVSVLAVVIALGVSMGAIWLFGRSPLAAIEALYLGSFGDRVQIGATLTKMVPLVLVALGWTIAFSAGRINIGFVGQIIAGGSLATIVGVNLEGLPAIVHLSMAVAAAMVGGAAWAGLAAWLWARFAVNEIISTLLLNLVAIQLLTWLVGGPLQEPTRSFPRSSHVAETARWPTLLEGTPLSWDILLVLLILGVVVILPRSTFGFHLKLTGANEEAARYAGVRTVTMSVIALVVSGALAGIAGSSLVLAGDLKSLSGNFQGNFGFQGIVVALVAHNSPVGLVPAALLFAALEQGGGLMQALAGVPSSLVILTNALVIVLVAAAAYFVPVRGSLQASRRTDILPTRMAADDSV